jgi:hypothetical protein
VPLAISAPAVTRHELAADLIADVRQLEQPITAVEARIKTAVAQANTSLLGLFGVGAGVTRPKAAAVAVIDGPDSSTQRPTGADAMLARPSSARGLRR